MALNTNALTTLDTAKGVLDIPLAELSRDAEVERLINSASQSIETMVDRKLIDQQHIEYFDGRRADRIILKEWPVTGGTADGNTKPELIFDNDSKFTALEDIQDVDDYYVDNDQELVLIRGRFPLGIRNVKVTYQAGFTTIPSDLEDACLKIVQWFESLETNRDLGKPSKSKQDENITVSQDFPEIILTLIKPYKRVQFSLGSIPILNG